MSKRLPRFLVLFLAYVSVCAVAIAAGPNFIQYRAELTDSLGNPVVDSTYTMHFSIYEDETGGVALWTEQHDVDTDDGEFRVKLGSVVTLHDSVFNDSLRWLGIRVEPEVEIEPREIIGSVPWAVNVGFVDKLKDKSVGKDELADKAVGTDQLDTAAVDSSKMKNKVVGKDKLKNKAVGTDQLDTAAVDTDRIRDKAVGKDKIKDKAIGTDQLDSAAVDTDKIKDKAVGKDKIKDKAVGTDQIDSLAVTKHKIGNGAVGFKKIAQEGAVPGDVIKWDGAQWAAAADVPFDDEDWSRAGNVLTTHGERGLARAGNTLHGPSDSTHVNLGSGNTTGEFGFDRAYITIAGGFDNEAARIASTVGGGSGNRVLEEHGAVGGGLTNQVGGKFTTVWGGEQNDGTPLAFWGFVGGGRSNSGDGNFSTLGGGDDNVTIGSAATVGGGSQNKVEAEDASVGGGQDNLVLGVEATAMGGAHVRSLGDRTTVGGGQANNAGGPGGSIGGGDINATADTAATIGGGTVNRASGTFSTVPGGEQSAARGMASLAMGNRAKANDKGSIVISASWTSLDSITDSAPYQMVLRADGFFYLTDQSEDAPGSGVEFLNTSTGGYLSHSGVWTSTSSVHAKEDFRPVDPDDVLETLAGLPITRWNYKVEGADVKHIGPTAQDFHRAFGLAGGDKAISATDPSGIALAAIKGLHTRTRRVERTSAALVDLRQRVDELSRRVDGIIAEMEASHD